MLTLIFLVLAVAIIFLCICVSNSSKEGKEGALMASLMATLILIGIDAAIAFNLYDAATIVGTSHTIEEKIAMYEDENAKIEESINILVEKYMEYEQKTNTDLKSKSLIQLVSLFPELKADDLVKVQINLHTSNNAQIKELKREQIEVSKAKWKLYFGK